MSEHTRLLKQEVHAAEQGLLLEEDNNWWGGRPELRKLWSTKNFKPRVGEDSTDELDAENDGHLRKSLSVSLDAAESQIKLDRAASLGAGKAKGVVTDCMVGTPGLIIALVLNLFLSMSFGQAFFPTSWHFPAEVPRAIGVQMFLFSTLISQIVVTAMSEFPSAMGMMMVENIPFMHIIAEVAVKAQGEGVATFATVLVTFALSTVVVGIAFYLLGALKIGNCVYFFPRHVIIGCIGGIGIFIFQTGLEVSCDKAWEWSLPVIREFLQPAIAAHWAASMGFVIVLRILLAVLNAPLLPPFYFVAIPPMFYLLLLLFGFEVQEARDQHWFFPAAEDVDPLLVWKLMDFGLVDWKVVSDCIPTIIALSLFR